MSTFGHLAPESARNDIRTGPYKFQRVEAADEGRRRPLRQNGARLSTKPLMINDITLKTGRSGGRYQRIEARLGLGMRDFGH